MRNVNDINNNCLKSLLNSFANTKKGLSLMMGIIIILSVVFVYAQESTLQASVRVLGNGTVQPFITINSPVNNVVYNGKSVLLNASLLGKANTLSYSINGAKSITLCSSCSSYSKAIAVAEGKNNLVVKAVVGSVSYSSSVLFTLDNTKPKIIATTPAKTAVNGNFGVEYTEANLKKVTLYYGLNSKNPENSKVFNCTSGTSKWCYVSVDLSAYNKKTIYYKFVVQDNSYSTSSKTVKVAVNLPASLKAASIVLPTEAPQNDSEISYEPTNIVEEVVDSISSFISDLFS